MKTVTYQGPKDTADPSTVYEIADGEQHVVLPLDQEVDVSNEIAGELKATKDHKFKIVTAKSSKGGDTTEED